MGTRKLRVLTFVVVVLMGQLGWAKTALILGSSVINGTSSLEAQSATALGFTVSVIDDATWDSMGTNDFAAYDVLIIGDPHCSIGGYLQAAKANATTWGAAVTGNIALIFTDPVFHADYLSAPKTLISNGIAFAGMVSGRTGLYMTMGCSYYTAVPNTPIAELGGIGNFTAEGQGNCPDQAHIVDATSPVISGLTDGSLSGWGCSAHGAFDSWPADQFRVVAIMKDMPAQYIAPDGTSGAPYILVRGEQVACDLPAVPPPADFTLTPDIANQWSASVSVSNDDGLVLRDVSLGPRYMAQQISIPYYNLTTSTLSALRGELTPAPNTADPVGQSRLIDFQQVFGANSGPTFDTSPTPRGTPTSVQATYAIKVQSGSCLVVKQRYEFWPEQPDGGCEPTASAKIQGVKLPLKPLPCNRFKPIVEYQFIGANGETLSNLHIPQRFHFQNNGRTRNYAKAYHDSDDTGPGVVFNAVTPYDFVTEAQRSAIDHGAAAQEDNYHQSYKPVSDPTPIPPGCEECVHIHWRWGKSIGIFAPTFPDLNGGLPLVGGSDQSVDIAVTAFHNVPEEIHPYDFTTLIDGEPISPADVVFWYSATGYLPTDKFFSHGLFFEPAQRADLSVVATEAPAPVTVGQDANYTITVKNAGPSWATAVQLEDDLTLPNITIDSANVPCTIQNFVLPFKVSCQLPEIGPNESFTINLALMMPGDSCQFGVCGSLTSHIIVSAKQGDPNPQNNDVWVGPTQLTQ